MFEIRKVCYLSTFSYEAKESLFKLYGYHTGYYNWKVYVIENFYDTHEGTIGQFLVENGAELGDEILIINDLI